VPTKTSFHLAFALEFPFFPLSNEPYEKNHKSGSKREQANPIKPDFCGTSENPGKNTKNTTAPQKFNHDFCISFG